MKLNNHQLDERKDIMENKKVVIGVAATRRDVFSKEEAKKYKEIVLDSLKRFDAVIVDIDDINEEGLLFDDKHVDLVVQKFRNHHVDGVFFPHANFGSEFLVAQVAKLLNLPVLLWGPRDDAPEASGARLRDTQCGLFATGKVLRRFRVPFTYITNCKINDRQFIESFERFIGVCSVIKAFRKIKILQVSNRPASFWTMIVNEGELLEKFGIQVLPITLTNVVKGVQETLRVQGTELNEAIQQFQKVGCSVFACSIPAPRLPCNAGHHFRTNSASCLVWLMGC
jgi:L-fucose isomerase-like protein